MTTELEKQFFETFGLIKYKAVSKYNSYIEYGAYKTIDELLSNIKSEVDGFNIEKIYPTITDTHYLELMCIFSDYINTTKKDIQELKNYILEEFITNKAGFSDEELIKIQALFKGE